MALLAPAVLFLAASAGQQPTAPPPPPPQQANANIDPAMQADLRRLLEDTGANELLKAQLDQIMAPIATMLKANPQLTPEFADEFVRRIKEKLLDGRIQNMTIQEYAKFFSRDDVQKMIAYQESPVGRKAKAAMPQIMAEIAARTSAEGQQVAHEVFAEIAREHPEYLNKSVPGGAAGGIIGGIIGATPSPPPAPTPAGFVGERVDRKAQEARLIKKVEPIYPPLAKSASVQGTVEFTVLIDTDGAVEKLALVSGHPLLINAARKAVMQWKYKPLIISGRPVKVVTDVLVNFHLNQ